MGLFTSKKVKDEQKKVVDIVSKLIALEDSVLEAKFKKTHARVAINFRDHVVELIEDHHGDKFQIKFNKSKVSLTKKQFANLMLLFEEALKKKASAEKNFDYLESILNK